ncbi:MAG: hypothetical protein BWK73_12960 [Thiothrix lacustris]|uniref:TIR domain-containing protein n=1 Tax=Thiothrix lacustris TaxID=525917 RepID=A0A1Y1QTJ1_9GAMM|nr:MAG: hypothetical protein BWK73_12960 [Thiothrix lacustris]
MYDIFLSYSTQDRERLMPLVSALEQQGWSVFWDHRSIPVGGDWHDMIGDAIRECRCVIVAWSTHSVDSKWVREEALEGRARSVLFPILLDDIPQPFGFKIIQSANFTRWNQRADHPEFLKLDTEIRRVLVHQLPPQQSTVAEPSPQRLPISTPPQISYKRLWGSGLAAIAVAVAAVLMVKQPPTALTPQPIVPQTPTVAVTTPPKPTIPPLLKQFAFEPDMLPISGGTFLMGCASARDEVEGGCFADEKPAREVTVADFKAGKYEITVGQYLACVKAGACHPPKPAPAYLGLGETVSDENYPIVGVSWDNAQQYTHWLSKETGKHYRLLTEAEWEYAARAGTETAYPWGNGLIAGQANCTRDFCRDTFAHAAPVGSFTANPFGLQDMHGNVWEWVQDNTDKGKQRVVRGGSWANRPGALRSAARHQHPPQHQHYLVGFRVASSG